MAINRKRVESLEQFEYLWELKRGIFKDKVNLFSSFVVGLPEDSRESLNLFREQLLDSEFNHTRLLNGKLHVH